ncbi:MAG: RnfABCDGE type electron transport complex subunit B [Candidatus Schekmanbacteria bacterium]|nr:RnfABCDGE type electron transport complex subunit B [Candidatus Schekmanbacteria bacterium]
MIEPVINSVLTLSGIGLVSGLGLGIAAKKFAVFVDPRVLAIEQVLPSANCGACGFAGCHNFAESVVTGKADVSGCLVGKDAVAQKVAAVMGIEAKTGQFMVARLLCQGDDCKAERKYHYLGIQDCKAASLLAGGDKACAYGCLGLGSCVGVCPVNAISLNGNGLVKVDEAKCIGCKKCTLVCPRKVIQMVPAAQEVTVLCNSVDKGPVVKKNCQIGCIGCALCKKACPVEGAIVVENFLARINPQLCDRCKKCVAKCPTHAII